MNSCPPRGKARATGHPRSADLVGEAKKRFESETVSYDRGAEPVVVVAGEEVMEEALEDLADPAAPAVELLDDLEGGVATGAGKRRGHDEGGAAKGERQLVHESVVVVVRDRFTDRMRRPPAPFLQRVNGPQRDTFAN